MKDQRIDAYIEKSAPFAKPILKHLRKLVHQACPEVEETMKWSTPAFDYKGVYCSMAAFNEHAAFGFWKIALLKDPTGNLATTQQEGRGAFGKLTSLKDLPPDEVIIDYLLQAKKLNDDGIKLPAKPVKKEVKTLEIPADFTAALNKNEAALIHFEKFSPSKKKDYIEWITEAKTETTRNKRLETSIEWLSEGKVRHWKYQK